MKFKNTYLIFSLLFIPIYLFHASIINYVHNFSKITYSLNIPENEIENNLERITSYRDLKVSNDIPLRQLISESWVISFPEITSAKLASDFSNSLEKIGITSVINITSEDMTESIAIGPFIDKEMAENIALKINNSIGYLGNIKRLNN